MKAETFLCALLLVYPQYLEQHLAYRKPYNKNICRMTANTVALQLSMISAIRKRI